MPRSSAPTTMPSITGCSSSTARSSSIPAMPAPAAVLPANMWSRHERGQAAALGMCGIAGFMLPQPALGRAEIEARLWAMNGTLRHRGPDDEGVWTDGLGALAHARLSIIDLSPAGHQPMASAGGEVWLTYNGEIYNFNELRDELAAIGYVFRSRTDSE